jgi:glycosyltransferase involved in cell wall biosynthesis
MRIILEGSDVITGTSATRRYSHSIIREFASGRYDDDFTVFLNCFRKNTSPIDRIIQSSPKFSKIHCPVPRRLSLPWWRTAGFPPVNLFQKKADIFHALGNDSPPAGTDHYIITLHGIAYISRPDLMDDAYVSMKRQWLDGMGKRAGFFLSVSETTTREFLDAYPFMRRESVKTVPLGISSGFRRLDKTYVRKSLASRFNITKPYLLYAGGLQQHKNIRGIISAFHAVAQDHNDLELVLAGADRRQNVDIDEVTGELKLGPRVRVIGCLSLDDDGLPVLYNGAECLVFPSFTEGWSSPPLESMACGTPVVTSNISSLPETVGDAALCVDPNRPDEIGHAIHTVLTDSSLRNDLVEKGLKRAARFTWRRCAEETYRFYRTIVNR